MKRSVRNINRQLVFTASRQAGVRKETVPDRPLAGREGLVRNSKVVFGLLKNGRLRVEPLISHILAPEEAAAAYDGLKNRKDEYQGVLFKWV